MIPLVGDIVDVLGALFWYTRVGVVGLGAAIEVVPLVDILPVNTAIGYYADNVRTGKSKE
jgi:hypothetical protein